MFVFYRYSFTKKVTNLLNKTPYRYYKKQTLHHAFTFY